VTDRFFTVRRSGERGTTFGDQITDSNDFDIRMMLQSELYRKLAESETDESHFDLSVGNRLPWRIRIDVCIGSLESGDV